MWISIIITHSWQTQFASPGQDYARANIDQSNKGSTIKKMMTSKHIPRGWILKGELYRNLRLTFPAAEHWNEGESYNRNPERRIICIYKPLMMKIGFIQQQMKACFFLFVTWVHIFLWGCKIKGSGLIRNRGGGRRGEGAVRNTNQNPSHHLDQILTIYPTNT